MFMHIFYGYVAYFYDPINLFCLLVSIGQIYEYQDYRSAVPLSIFATISTVNHVYSMSLKLRQQYAINHTPVNRYTLRRGLLTTTRSEMVDIFTTKQIAQMKLKRGDYVKLSDQTSIPADLLIVNGPVSVQELELTGEDIVVSKVSCVDETIDLRNVCNDTQSLSK